MDKKLAESIYRIHELAEIIREEYKTKETWALLLEAKQHLFEAKEILEEEPPLRTTEELI